MGGIILVSEKRTVRLEVTFTETEYAKLRDDMKSTGIKTMTHFLRVMALRGCIINLDLRAILEPVKLVRNIASNVNQISARVNSNGSIYKADVDELKEKCEKLTGSVSEIVGYISKLET
jgi:hypothetical protein